jgi:hypothetical protein
MDRDQYFVVLHDSGRHSHPYTTQSGAIGSAVEAAKAAHDDEKLSQSSFRVKISHFSQSGPTGRTLIRPRANQT